MSYMYFHYSLRASSPVSSCLISSSIPFMCALLLKERCMLDGWSSSEKSFICFISISPLCGCHVASISISQLSGKSVHTRMCCSYCGFLSLMGTSASSAINIDLFGKSYWMRVSWASERARAMHWTSSVCPFHSICIDYYFVCVPGQNGNGKWWSYTIYIKHSTLSHVV